MSWRSHLHFIVPAKNCTKLFSKKSKSGDEPLVTQFPIWLARDLNLRPPALGANALSLNHPTLETDLCTIIL